jgi:hypothetical protein
MTLNLPRSYWQVSGYGSRIVNLGICCQTRDVVAHTFALVEATTLRMEMA